MVSQPGKCWALLGVFAACLLPWQTATAQNALFSEVHTVAAATAAAPVEETLSISNAGTYQITLTDLGALLTPSAPLTAVKLAVTSGSQLVGTPLLAAGSTTITATPGTYVIHVVGTPGSVPGSGPIGIEVTNTADNSGVAAFSDILAVPPQALPSSEAVLNDSFSAPGGTYTVSLADLQIPRGENLATLTLLLIAQGATMPLAILPDPNNHGALSATVTLTEGVTYRIFAVGQTSATATGGLFSAVVAPSGGGSPVYAHTRAVGGTMLVGSPALAAGDYTFKLTDLTSPAALSQLQAVLVRQGAPVATLTAGGAQNFTAVADTYDAFAFAAPASAAGAGSYALGVLSQGGGAPALDVARAVTTPGGPLSGYGFDTTLNSAGTYTVSDADFAIPAPLTSLRLVVAQNGALLGSPIVLGGGSASTSITASSGPITLLAFAQAGTAGGLFGANITAAGAPSPVYEITQGVGDLFRPRQIAITSAGTYSVTATDLKFPAAFANFDVVVTQGTKQLGAIYGGGTFPFTATPGKYFINFVAQPTGSDAAGTYALSVQTAPPAPTINFSADHTSVSNGSTVDLIWSTQNATSCSASGGWTGTQPVSGTATSAALTSDTTFTLQCAGAGGSAQQSVSVTVTSSSGGGGGEIGPDLLALLLATILWRFVVVMRPSRALPRVSRPFSSS